MDSLCLDTHGVDSTPVIRGEHLDHTHSIHWDVRGTSTVASDTWGGGEAGNYKYRCTYANGT